MFVNVGAERETKDSYFPTKKALKDAIAANPSEVQFYGTSNFTPFSGTGDDLVIGVKYQVTGPDPFNNRKWYATVEKLPNGTIRVS